MVIGATETSDAQILRTSSELYQSFQLRRVYYSAYSPISDADSRLPAKPPPLVREHRLYQADWLLRHYGFDAGEITPSDAPDLDLEVDPKLAWALRNRGLFPVDLNTAEREMLLRVPGVGVRNVARILKMRRHQAVRLCHLERLRVPLGRARPFIVTADQGSAPAQLDSAHLARALRTDNRQLDLFEAASAAVTGQL